MQIILHTTLQRKLPQNQTFAAALKLKLTKNSEKLKEYKTVSHICEEFLRGLLKMT